MKYTSRKTTTDIKITKEFNLIDAAPRQKKYTKGLTYLPNLLRVVYRISNGNVLVDSITTHGNRVLKSGDEGDRVEERFYADELKEDGLVAIAAIVQENRPDVPNA